MNLEIITKYQFVNCICCTEYTIIACFMQVYNRLIKKNIYIKEQTGPLPTKSITDENMTFGLLIPTTH